MISSSMNSRFKPLTVSPVALSLILNVFSQAVRTLWQSTRPPPLTPQDYNPRWMEHEDSSVPDYALAT